MCPANERPCPCGSGGAYEECCGPLHDNRIQAETAEQLMRSRYAAYVVGRFDHVLRTWHPRTRPDKILPTPGVMWTGLTIGFTEDGQPGDDEGLVEFDAAYRTGSGQGVQHELSRFLRRGGRWCYVDGDVS